MNALNENDSNHYQQGPESFFRKNRALWHHQLTRLVKGLIFNYLENRPKIQV
jgi:hypothetical protein